MSIKPLEQQTIVLTGASSGIGLVTARHAAKAGAKLVLAARNEDALRQLTQEITAQGGQAIYVVTDVGDEDQVKVLAQKAVEHFGGFDTWINNAGMAIYGELSKVSTADHRRMFDTNFWGIVYGSLAAADHFRARGGNNSGVLINLGSVDSDRALPIQGMYATSKFAVKGFTDALRMELKHEGVPVEVCLVKPSAIGTPFAEHARNYLDKEATLPPPIYAPELVADAILKCAAAPQRDVFVGGGGRMLSMLGEYFPGLGDKILGATMFSAQTTDAPNQHKGDSLYGAGSGMKERGEFDTPVIPVSAYTTIVTHPWLKTGVLLGAGALLLWKLGGDD